MIATRDDARKLLLEGSQALARIEHNGIRIDVPYMERVTQDTRKIIRDLEASMRDSAVFKAWRKKYGTSANLGSDIQMADVFFNVLGYESKGKTDTGRDKADEASFAHIDEPFLKDYFRCERLKRVLSSGIGNIRREMLPNGMVHGVFNLHIVQTYRSSMDSPNLQNQAVRDPELAAIVRNCFIPREGHQFIEVDLVGAEVRVSVCYHKDPVMLNYIEDPTTDMHRDMGVECFLLDSLNVPKGWWKQKGVGGGHDVRHCTKNQFVFPQFYGSVYFQCAANIWETMDRANLSFGDVKLKDHLASRGITSLGLCDPQYSPRPNTFERHLQEVEKRFWKKRFRGYDSWKRNWWNQYRQTGGFHTLTGFYIEGIFSRNDVTNYPIQGSAFHCLLWTIIRLQRWLTKNRMRTVLVNQVHDSVLLDVYPPEKDDVLEKIRQLMTEGIRREWTWVIAPLEIEVEEAPVGGSWHDKKKVA